VVELCNVDINQIHDDESLEAWHRSIDVTDPRASEILGYILFLRSTSKLQEESNYLKNSICMIGEENKQALLQRLDEKRWAAEQSKQERMEEDPEGRMVVEVENATQAEGPGGTGTDQGLHAMVAIISDDAVMTEGPNSEPIVAVSQVDGGDGDGISTQTDTVFKRKRVSSMAATLSEVSIP